MRPAEGSLSLLSPTVSVSAPRNSPQKVPGSSFARSNPLSPSPFDGVLRAEGKTLHQGGGGLDRGARGKERAGVARAGHLSGKRLSGLKPLVPVLPAPRPEPHGARSEYSPWRNPSGLSAQFPIAQNPINCHWARLTRSDSWLPETFA